jgi:hypothetical protein
MLYQPSFALETTIHTLKHQKGRFLPLKAKKQFKKLQNPHKARFWF